MALFPTTLQPFSTTALLTPMSFVSVPAQGGKLTSRKHSTVGHQWQEQYEIDLGDQTDRAWKTQIEKLAYDGSVLTNKQHPFEQFPLGLGGIGRVSGSGQLGDTIKVYGFTSGSTPFLAGDVIQFASGSNVLPIYQVVQNLSINALGSGSLTVVPDVLLEYQPAHSSSFTTGTSVNMSCMIFGLQIDPVSAKDRTNLCQVTILFRESL